MGGREPVDDRLLCPSSPKSRGRVCHEREPDTSTGGGFLPAAPAEKIRVGLRLAAAAPQVRRDDDRRGSARDSGPRPSADIELLVRTRGHVGRGGPRLYGGATRDVRPRGRRRSRIFASFRRPASRFISSGVQSPRAPVALRHSFLGSWLGLRRDMFAVEPAPSRASLSICLALGGGLQLESRPDEAGSSLGTSRVADGLAQLGRRFAAARGCVVLRSRLARRSRAGVGAGVPAGSFEARLARARFFAGLAVGDLGVVSRRMVVGGRKLLRPHARGVDGQLFDP